MFFDEGGKMTQHGNGVLTSRKKLLAKTILIVEDDGAIAQLLMYLLALRTSYNLLLAFDASQALDIVHRQRVDLFVLLYHLSHGPNGLELFDLLHRISGCEHVPAILISAMLPQEQIASRNISGIRQPFEFNDLLERIQRLLAKPPLP